MSERRDGTWARREVREMVEHDYTAPYPAEIGKGQRVAEGWVFRVTFRKARWGQQRGFGPEYDRWYTVHEHGGTSLTPEYMAKDRLRAAARSGKKKRRSGPVRNPSGDPKGWYHVAPPGNPNESFRRRYANLAIGEVVREWNTLNDSWMWRVTVIPWSGAVVNGGDYKSQKFAKGVADDIASKIKRNPQRGRRRRA